MEAGAISDEQLYNETGLTGEAGREAMATNMLSRGSKFWKGGKGRILMASLMKRNERGELGMDKDAMRKIMSGEMSVDETIASRSDHLGTMNRADFILNEGRFRGEAMSAFGGMGQTFAYRGWLKNKGYDPMSGGSKATLALMKHSGMDRDQAENQMRLIRNSDSIMDVQMDRMREDEISRETRAYNQTTGVEGFKRNIEQAKKEINNSFREAGQNIMNDAEGLLDSFIQDITGRYTRRVVKGVGKASRLMKEGVSGERIDAMQGTLDLGFSSEDLSAAVSRRGQTIGRGDKRGIGMISGASEYDVLSAMGEQGLANAGLGGEGLLEKIGLGTALGGISAAADYFGADITGIPGFGGAGLDSTNRLSTSERRAGAAMLRDNEGLSLDNAMFFAAQNRGDREGMQTMAKKIDAQRRQMEKSGTANDGELKMMRRMSAVMAYNAAESDAEKARVLERRGISLDQMQGMQQMMKDEAIISQTERASQVAREVASNMDNKELQRSLRAASRMGESDISKDISAMPPEKRAEAIEEVLKKKRGQKTYDSQGNELTEAELRSRLEAGEALRQET